MNKQNLELLGLTEEVGKDEITQAYNELKAKYKEERFLDGEAGNYAAKMLTKIETAYTELMSELSQNSDSSANGAGAAFESVERFIEVGNYDDAQRVLDTFNERDAQWHYLQSIVFYRKNWVNESKKQLEIAMRLEPDNQKYKDSYKKMNDKIEYDAAKNKENESSNSAYNAQNMDTPDDGQMGGPLCCPCIPCCFC